MYNKKGFTLIELLLVISIIAVLSSIVLSNLKHAQILAADAAIKADLMAIRSRAEILYYDLDNTYGNTSEISNWCNTLNGSTDFKGKGSIFEDKNVQQAIAHANSLQTTTNGSACFIRYTNTGYFARPFFAIAIPLRSEGKIWCMDSLGTFRDRDHDGVDYTGTIDGSTPAVTENGFCQ
jgi:prepilin-type N-terminal cleavage/methylation domain-containing protein